VADAINGLREIFDSSRNRTPRSTPRDPSGYFVQSTFSFMELAYLPQRRSTSFAPRRRSERDSSPSRRPLESPSVGSPVAVTIARRCTTGLALGSASPKG